MKHILSIVLVAFIIGFVSCNNQQKTNDETAKMNAEKSAVHDMATKFFMALPATADNPDNELSEQKIALGKLLYYDVILSKDQTQSCNTCHNIATYGVDNSPTSKGDDGGFGTRNSPTTFNAALHISQFWDGRNADVEQQAG